VLHFSVNGRVAPVTLERATVTTEPLHPDPAADAGDEDRDEAVI